METYSNKDSGNIKFWNMDVFNKKKYYSWLDWCLLILFDIERKSRCFCVFSSLCLMCAMYILCPWTIYIMSLCFLVPCRVFCASALIISLLCPDSRFFSCSCTDTNWSGPRCHSGLGLGLTSSYTLSSTWNTQPGLVVHSTLVRTHCTGIAVGTTCQPRARSI